MINTKKERCLKEVENILSLAKLSKDDIKPLSQAIYFTEQNLYNHNFRLLQLDPRLLQEITEGSELCFKGEKDEELVICSETQTFQVVEAETSNSLLLVNDMKFPKDIDDSLSSTVHGVKVKGIFYEYLEASVGKPHLKKLDDLLKSFPYKGPEHEFEVNKENLYSFDDLCDKIQASKSELKEALSTMTVVEISGKIRTLDIEYHFRILSYMLKLLEENSWELDEVDFKETVDSLKELAPKEVVSHLFDKYTEESKEIDGIALYKYKEDEVCKFFAKVLLHETGKFNLNEFLQAWRDSVPEGMVPDEEMLYGIAIIDRKSNPNFIWAFEESNLPENINERFKILFAAKEKWSVPEISPYIKRLATDKIDVNALLAKHARASKINGVKYYSSKHGK
ncbi:sister chromatid cohesion protein DCC1 [Diabrotica virgifera virgifera]|uniref:Sister chromatid cohesion protein DCC1 n=1 Tax=Diabrotica virgifera virgifera TaxID=50390 RepID=A0A6P7FKF2_DIAVI|nr:sister chromatid cohesion protein DCC1 [Diabrotica virgifera virgifera]